MHGPIVKAYPRSVREAFFADFTGEWSFSCVDTSVDFERSRLCEAFAAVIAAIWLFSSVGPLVSPHSRQMWEPPTAIPTGVRPLPSVNAPVNLQRTGLAKALSTVSAGVWSRACMNIQVDAKITVRVEGPATFGAKEPRWFVCMLSALVLQQLRRSGESSSAMHTGVRCQQRRLARLLLLLLLLRTSLAASRSAGPLAKVARARDLRVVRETKMRGGKARRGRAVVAVVMGLGEVW